MKIDDLKTRINELIALAGTTLTRRHSKYPELLNGEAFSEFKTASLSFLLNVFGKDHPFYTDFFKWVKDVEPSDTEHGRGILKAAKQEIDNGWLISVKELVSAEIFSDFLEMAEYLLSEGYKDPAAVMLGSVLEEHLRQLCLKHNIAIQIEKHDKMFPKKAETLNTDLSSAAIYNKLDQKSVTTWYDIRNKAAHGNYGEYTKEQVKLMYEGIVNFIMRTT